MKFLLRFVAIELILIWIAVVAFGQNTTVSATVTDPDAFNWAGGSIQFNLFNGQGGTVTYHGVPLTANQLSVTFGLNGGGAFSGALSDNTLLSPVGTQWDVSVCPQASAPCQQLQRVVVSGATQSLTTTINPQLRALRFPASYGARAYGQVEISPIPPAGGTYYDITIVSPRFWNGTSWVTYGGGGGGGNPHTPAASQQVANSGVNGFDSDPNFLIDTATHTRTSSANDVVNSFSSIPRAIYDPVDTKYLGGLAAAQAGTSGHTPTEVINAAIDDAFCKTKTSNALAGWIRTPPWQLAIDGIKLWPNQRLGSDSIATETFMGHSPVTAPMVAFHANTDTITCNSTVYTPGFSSNGEIAYISISGNFTGAQDIGIFALGTNTVHDIQGFGVAFGQQAIRIQGTSANGFRLGLPGQQIAGCQDFLRGISTGNCGSVQLDNLDGNEDQIYATDGGSNFSGHGPGSCYPNCSAVAINGPGSSATHIFAQLSDVGIAINGAEVRGGDWRVDATSMEGIRYADTTGASLISRLKVSAPCLSDSLKTNYDAHVPTNCFGILSSNGSGGASITTEIGVGGNGFFGQSYIQCEVGDAANSGSGASNTWGLVIAQGNPGNTTPNDNAVCGSNNALTSPRWLFPNAGTPVEATGPDININAISRLWLTNGTTAENFTSGVAGQQVTISAVPTGTATLDVAGNFKSCTGLPVVVTNDNPIVTTVNAFTARLDMNCNPPNVTPTHINYFQNPTPSNPSLLSVYGNVQAIQVPVFTNAANQIHGPTLGSGQYCFAEEHTYPDGSHNVTAQFCTPVDLTAQTPGEIFQQSAPQISGDNLYLTVNSSGSSLHLGKIGVAAGGFWDGPTTIAAGGDNTNFITPGENTTGAAYLGFGIRGPTTAPSGACTSFQGGHTVISQDGHGTACPIGGGTWTTKW